MRSITRTLTLSLSAAAMMSFVCSLLFVVWLDTTLDAARVPCEVVSTVLGRAIAVNEDGLQVRPTRDVVALKAKSPGLWYVVSLDGLMAEFGSERRPALPVSIPYRGPIGLSSLSANDQSSFCLDVVRRGNTTLVMLAGGAQVSFKQVAKSFVVRNIYHIAMIASAFAATVAAGAVLSSFIVARSIGRVTQRALAIDPTAPQSAISLEGAPVELRPLLTALNRAFGEIDTYVQKQRRFLGNAAHQLRTPLTLMRAKIEDLPEPARTALIRDVRRLSSLVSAMLDLARLQGNVIEKAPFNLVSVTQDVLADFSPSALDAGIELSLEQEREGAIVVHGVEAAIRSALGNLVGNALIHAHGAKRIVAHLAQGMVSISDDGSDTANYPKRRLIEPFQTGSPDMESAGLGLAIVQEIMVAHGGSLVMSSNSDGGTTACLQFCNPGLLR